MPIEQEYWKRAEEGRAISDYPEVDSIDFPMDMPIAYAVCVRECGNAEFIVDGSTQICEYCGGTMFRTEVRTYALHAESAQAIIAPGSDASERNP